MNTKTEEQKNIERDVRVGALSLIVGAYIRNFTGRDLYKEEFLGFMDCRYQLSMSQRDWCADLLVFYSTQPYDVDLVISAAGELLKVGDFLVTNSLLTWFDLAEAGGLAYEASTQNLFTREVCQAFLVLGIKPTFRAKTVRSSFSKKINSVHPDRAFHGTIGEAQDMTVKILSARSTIINFYKSLQENGV